MEATVPSQAFFLIYDPVSVKDKPGPNDIPSLGPGRLLGLENTVLKRQYPGHPSLQPEPGLNVIHVLPSHPRQ